MIRPGKLEQTLSVLDQQGCSAPENLDVGDTEQASIVTIFGFVQGEQVIIFSTENRLVGGQRLALAFVRPAHIDRKGKIVPGWLHFAMGEEEALNDPGFLVCKQFSTWHAFPLSQPCQEHRCAYQPQHRPLLF
jgi:hypothetical protein